jgi:hypothetical protein
MAESNRTGIEIEVDAGGEPENGPSGLVDPRAIHPGPKDPSPGPGSGGEGGLSGVAQSPSGDSNGAVWVEEAGLGLIDPRDPHHEPDLGP